ncbi:MAG: hypothetical protein IJH64_12440, partial [Oscillospiraceae bacterium]|nr:hypothetical protein [Oscillospiraceae bacterium]
MENGARTVMIRALVFSCSFGYKLPDHDLSCFQHTRYAVGEPLHHVDPVVRLNDCGMDGLIQLRGIHPADQVRDAM